MTTGDYRDNVIPCMPDPDNETDLQHDGVGCYSNSNVNIQSLTFGA